MAKHKKTCASVSQLLLTDPPQVPACDCGAEELEQLAVELEERSKHADRCDLRAEEAEIRRASAERERDKTSAAAVRIAQLIAEAEADKTIPSDPHCGEAIILRRIRDALKAHGL